MKFDLNNKNLNYDNKEIRFFFKVLYILTNFYKKFYKNQ